MIFGINFFSPLQELNRSPPDSVQRLALQQSVYRISKHYGVLPPNLDLKSGEVRRIGLHAVGGNTVFDIYEGRWLDRDKVALKAIREARGSSEKWEVCVDSHVWQ